MRLGPGAGLVMPTNVLWEWGWSDYKADVFQSRMRTAKWGLDATQPQRSRFPLFPVFHIAAFQEAPSLMTTIKINSITCHHHPLGAEYLWDFLFIIFPGSLLLCGLVLSQAIWRHAANFPNHGDVFAFVWKSMKGKPHFFFFFSFFSLPLICHMDDSDTCGCWGQSSSDGSLCVLPASERGWKRGWGSHSRALAKCQVLTTDHATRPSPQTHTHTSSSVSIYI